MKIWKKWQSEKVEKMEFKANSILYRKHLVGHEKQKKRAIKICRKKYRIQSEFQTSVIMSIIMIKNAFLMHWIPLWYTKHSCLLLFSYCWSEVSFVHISSMGLTESVKDSVLQYMILLPGVTTDQCPVVGTSCGQFIPDICRWPGPGTCPPDTHVLACRAVVASVADAQYCWWVIWSLLYIALFSAHEQTHCARMWFYMSE